MTDTELQSLQQQSKAMHRGKPISTPAQVRKVIAVRKPYRIDNAKMSCKNICPELLEKQARIKLLAEKIDKSIGAEKAEW